MRARLKIFAWTIPFLLGSLWSTGHAADITGAGSTFAYPLIAKWAEAYRVATGTAVAYEAVGSGAGIKLIRGGTVEFGASDMPLKPEDLETFGLIQFPVMIGGVVPVLNVPGTGAGPLRLDGPTLADIFLGKVTRWDDPALAALNPGVTLPAQGITVVYRLDGSGTTFVLAQYLTELSAEWKEKIGAFTSVQFPVGIGARGNEGIAETVGRTSGAIGYVEYAYAKQHKLGIAVVKNTAGQFAAPSGESFQAAASNADWQKVVGSYVLLSNQPGAKTWPITGSSFILVHKTQDRPEKAKAVFAFFDWAYRNGGGLASDLDYVPIPAGVVGEIEQTWSRVKAENGQPVWTDPRM